MTTDSQPSATTTTARDLAVALFDLAWLLPRTVGAEHKQPDPLPRSELEVMRLVGRRPGLGVTAIARELGLQVSNASTTVRALEAKGLLERSTSPDDARHVVLQLSALAQEHRRERERRWGDALTEALGWLEAADAQRLVNATPAIAALARALAASPP